MGVYEVTSPQGETYEVTAPEGASEQEVLSYAKQNFSQSSKPAWGDVIAGLPATRFAMGAVSPLLAAAQLNPLWRAPVTMGLEKYEQAKQRGMKAAKNEGFDWMGLAGQIAPSTAIAKGVTSALPVAKGLLGRIGTGMAAGGAVGATTPVTSPDNFAEQKALQTGIGAATGGAIPLGSAALSKGKEIVSPLLDLFRKGGEKNILTKYQKDILGPNVEAVRERLQAAKQLVPGSRPTAAEAVAGLPEGSPILAHQQITSKTPGGISAQFGERTIKQEGARKIAAKTRDVLTAEARERALVAANQGGVKANEIIKDIARMETTPGWRTSDVVQKTLSEVREKIAAIKDQKWRVDANDLYTIRKELGNMIQKHSKDSASWDKKLSAMLQNRIQDSIDNAIEKAGGTGWKSYLADYSSRSQAIAEDIGRKKLSLKPPQRTQLRGGVDVTQEITPHLPQMLSRPMMLANFIANKIGRGIEPRLDTEAARRYLNPQLLADALQDIPPQQRNAAMLQALRLLGTTVPTVYAGRSMNP